MKTAVTYLLLFIITLGLAGFFTFYSITLITDSAEELVLPRLTGNNIVDVLEILTNMGLNPKLKGTRYHESMPRYHVLSQDPAPGTIIKKGRDVILYISKGREQIIMPDLRHTAVREADLLLEKNELTAAVMSYAFSRTHEKNTVIDQYPKPFSQVDKNTPCSLLVSKGPAPIPYAMPRLVDLFLSHAVSLAEINHLNLTAVQARDAAHHEPDTVLAQEPEEGSFLDNFSPVSIVVNTNKNIKQLSIKDLQGTIPILYKIHPGFLKKHIIIKAVLFGYDLELFNDHVSPGKQVCVLIPSGIQTKVTIFEDDKLIRVRQIDPWSMKTDSGDILWE